MNQENKERLTQHQYADAGNFNARIHLHKTYGMNKYPWPFWVFDRMKREGHAQVLELGGGNGLLWMANSARIPEDWEITVSDLSPGMLRDAEKNLARLGRRLAFEVIDAEDIPHPDDGFDIVIANHMLYHIPNRRKALSEIRRVLKPDGAFYASTVGNRNMQELKDIIVEFDPGSMYEQVLGTIESSFSLENGREQLLEFFGDVRLDEYEDALSVTDSEAIVHYVLSLNGLDADRTVLDPGNAGAFRQFLDGRMEQSGGKLQISKASGIFVCKI